MEIKYPTRLGMEHATTEYTRDITGFPGQWNQQTNRPQLQGPSCIILWGITGVVLSNYSIIFSSVNIYTPSILHPYSIHTLGQLSQQTGQDTGPVYLSDIEI